MLGRIRSEIKAKAITIIFIIPDLFTWLQATTSNKTKVINYNDYIKYQKFAFFPNSWYSRFQILGYFSLDKKGLTIEVL